MQTSSINASFKSFTAVGTALAASAATLVLALAPAIGAAPSADAGLRVVQLPRVVVSAAREPRTAALQRVELERVVIVARRDAAPAMLVGAAEVQRPVMARQPG